MLEALPLSLCWMTGTTSLENRKLFRLWDLNPARNSGVSHSSYRVIKQAFLKRLHPSDHVQVHLARYFASCMIISVPKNSSKDFLPASIIYHNALILSTRKLSLQKPSPSTFTTLPKTHPPVLRWKAKPSQHKASELPSKAV